jgi:hypothetical protein
MAKTKPFKHVTVTGFSSEKSTSPNTDIAKVAKTNIESQSNLEKPKPSKRPRLKLKTDFTEGDTDADMTKNEPIKIIKDNE